MYVLRRIYSVNTDLVYFVLLGMCATALEQCQAAQCALKPLRNTAQEQWHTVPSIESLHSTNRCFGEQTTGSMTDWAGEFPSQRAA